MSTLFDNLNLGDISLTNRIIMAPLTRMRSKQPGNIPYALNTEYYAQRAGAGLIISEATQISQQGQGYPATPGIHTKQQVEGWKAITQAVHDRAGKIVLQLWHVGRISHSSHQPGGGLPVAPSAIAPSGKVFTADWKQLPYETPRALEVAEIKAILADFTNAAHNAKDAGFDGVEVHGANGYLLDQFLHDGSNKRTDRYGGSIENRARFLLEAVDAVVGVWGKGRVGVRLSPYGTFNDMSDSNTDALFAHTLDALSARGIAYLHMIEPRATGAGGSDAVASDAPSTSELFRSHFKGAFISAGGYTPESAKEAVESGAVDAVAFGRCFIANPDLPERIRTGSSLNAYDRATFYGGAEKGYTDYPFFGPAGRLIIMKGKSMVWLIVGALLAGAAALGPIASDVEQAKYTVIESHEDVEIRQYDPAIVAEVRLSGEREKAISEGFKLLAGYIFGDNQANAKIAMTAPVSQQQNETIAMTAPVVQQANGEQWQVHFVMPSNYTMDSLPVPTNPKVQLHTIAKKKFAVIRFSGAAGTSALQQKTKDLEAFIANKKMKAAGAPSYAFFNPPWTLPFLRRNEVMIEILE